MVIIKSRMFKPVYNLAFCRMNKVFSGTLDIADKSAETPINFTYLPPPEKSNIISAISPEKTNVPAKVRKEQNDIKYIEVL